MIIEWEILSLDHLKEFSRHISEEFCFDKTKKYGVVYALEFEGGKVKVGKTLNPDSRFITVARNYGDTPKKALACLTDDYSGVENKVLCELSDYNSLSEFFYIDYDKVKNAIISNRIYITHDLIFARNEKYEQLEKPSPESIVDFFKAKTSTITDHEFEIIKSKMLLSFRMFGSYDCIDYSDLINILNVDMSIENLNEILIKAGLFDSLGVVSDYSFDERLMRCVNSEYVDFDFITHKVSSILVSQKGVDYIRKILKKELK